MSQSNSFWVSQFTSLRQRLIYVMLFFITILFITFFNSNIIMKTMIQPLFEHLPLNGKIIATNIISPVLTPLLFCLYLSIYISIPFFMLQLWLFMKDGLKKEERRLFWLFFMPATILFYLGTIFAFKVIFPMMMFFFTMAGPDSITLMPDIHQYFIFFINTIFAFGVAFEIPVVILILTSLNILSINQLREHRPIVIILNFSVAMFITPPDVISQILIALPMCVLFELGILIATIHAKRYTSSKLRGI